VPVANLPAETDRPSDFGLLAWNFPLYLPASSSYLGVAGTLYVVKLHIPVALSVSNVVVNVAVAGNTLTAGQCFAALYEGSEGGSLIGVTADRSTAWGSVGIDVAALVGGPYAVPVGDVYVAAWFRGTTGPAFTRVGSTSSAINGLLAASAARWGSANTGLTTTAPGTVGTIAKTTGAYWAGLS